MAIAIRTAFTSGLFLCVTCCLPGNAEAGRHGLAVVAIPVPAVVPVAVPGCVCTAPAIVPMPVGSFANVRDFPGGAVYGRSYRVMSPAWAPASRRAIRRVVKYGRSDFVGTRGYAAVVSPWPLIPVTTPSRPFGVGVVPPGEVVAWQSPRGYFYRGNYQSPVMQFGLPGACPQSLEIPAESVEVVPRDTFEVPLEPVPTPAAENGPAF